jgi:hypothetical protein
VLQYEAKISAVGVTPNVTAYLSSFRRVETFVLAVDVEVVFRHVFGNDSKQEV